MQLAQLHLSSSPQASDFIPQLNRFDIPYYYYRQLVHTARLHQQTAQEPRLQVVTKPHGGYGWLPRQEVIHSLAMQFEQAENDPRANLTPGVRLGHLT
jgi:hypothetical protein